MYHENLFIKYIDTDGNEHLQSISDLLDVGRLIEGDGPNEGDDMELADGLFYNSDGFPTKKVEFED